MLANVFGHGVITYLGAAKDVPKRILVIELIRRSHGLRPTLPCYHATSGDAWLALGFGLAALSQKCYISICSM